MAIGSLLLAFMVKNNLLILCCFMHMSLFTLVLGGLVYYDVCPLDFLIFCDHDGQYITIHNRDFLWWLVIDHIA